MWGAIAAELPQPRVSTPTHEREILRRRFRSPHTGQQRFERWLTGGLVLTRLQSVMKCGVLALCGAAKSGNYHFRCRENTALLNAVRDRNSRFGEVLL